VQARFAYAHEQVKRIPTGIDWAEVAEHVDVLLWEAATDAAHLSSLDAELYELRYAEPGTPQAAFARQLGERRQEYDELLLGIQQEAEDLARRAGNAAAAAHLALVRTGDLRRLEVVIPSLEAIKAQDALARAKDRLDLLAAGWAELDPGGAAPRRAPQRRLAGTSFTPR